jgi:hypothetical protein
LNGGTYGYGGRGGIPGDSSLPAANGYGGGGSGGSDSVNSATSGNGGIIVVRYQIA